MRWLIHDSAAMLEHSTGHVPVILTAAHAGDEAIASLGGVRADPGDGAFNGGAGDTRTREVLEAMLESLDLNGLRPWVVLPRVSRKDIDLNRTWAHNEAGLEAGGVPISGQTTAKAIYDAYFKGLQDAITAIRSAFDAQWSSGAFLFDIHGIALPATIDIEIGTRSGTSADPALVYSIGTSIPGLAGGLTTAGFRLTATPSPATEAFNGVTVLETVGLGAGGVNAVQFELSQLLRGFAASDTKAQREVAFTTGRGLARAVSTLLRAQGYPSLALPPSPTSDDDNYAALMLS